MTFSEWTQNTFHLSGSITIYTQGLSLLKWFYNFETEGSLNENSSQFGNTAITSGQSIVIVALCGLVSMAHVKWDRKIKYKLTLTMTIFGKSIAAEKKWKNLINSKNK